MSGGGSSSNVICEYCDLPLGLFKRKRMCPGCSRWFCTSCLPRDYQFQAANLRLGRNPLGPTPICERCSILAIDNVTKDQLMELRVKDLRQYLESKRIPTAGCREKSELVDLVLEHCCSDAFLRQQAENQRRLRELTRRKEAEEEWEERHGRNHNDISPDSVDSTRRFNTRVASSSPETSSGADDPDDVSIGEEIEIDPPAHPDDALGAAARTASDNWRPVYEVVDDFRPPNGVPERSYPVHVGRDSARVEMGVDAGALDDQNGAATVAEGASSSHSASSTSAPVAPPSYDEVMASSTDNGANETIDETRTENYGDEATPMISEAATMTTSTTTTTTSSSPANTSTATTAASTSGASGAAGTSSSALHPPSQTSASGDGADSLSSSPNRFTGRRRIRLEELERVEDIKDMTPRQLKEILTANFVAYKGCCERWELEDRVKRLWNEYRVNQEVLRQTYERDDVGASASGEGASSSSVSGDQASTASSSGVSGATTSTAHQDVDSQLCKICWDAVIDCVLLECGHMVTCTDCGRRMAECPICRQYVVRAVHVFRA